MALLERVASVESGHLKRATTVFNILRFQLNMEHIILVTTEKVRNTTDLKHKQAFLPVAVHKSLVVQDLVSQANNVIISRQEH